MQTSAPLLLTGLNGTVAPRVAQEAQRRGYRVASWDRARISPQDSAAVLDFLSQLQPAGIVHLAMGSETWAAQLAEFAGRSRIPFIFTSTAMVFDHLPNGPHHVGEVRSARDDYGRYKIRCEDAVLGANADAMVVRLGWQIDPEVRGNNMLRALDDWQQREACVAASRAWRPACSFMSDTAVALLDLMQQAQVGVHHLDSNATEGHSFDAIVLALKEQYQRKEWLVRVHEDYVHDQRLVGGTLSVPTLSERLRSLRG